MLCRNRGGQEGATDQARRSQQALGEQDMDERATEELCLHIDFSIATDLDSDKKKKKRPPGFRASHFVFCM